MKTGNFMLTFVVALLAASMMTLPAQAWGKGGKGGGGNGGGNGGGGEEPTTTLSFVWTSIGSGFGDVMNNHGDVAWDESSTIFVSIDDGNGGRKLVDLKTVFLSQGLYSVPDGTDFSIRWPEDINDDGQIILWIQERLNNQTVYQAQYLYTPERIVAGITEAARLDLLPDQCDSVNNAGVAAGSPPGPDLLVWDSLNGTVTVATASDGYGIWAAPAINLFGEIAVEGFIAGTSRRVAMKYSTSNGLERLFRKDPSTSSVIDINENGTIVGHWSRNLGSPRQAFRSQIDGKPENIAFGGDFSEPVSINNLEDIVGYVTFSGQPVQLPYLYTDSYGSLDILDNSINAPNVPTWQLNLRSINDQRQILIVHIDSAAGTTEMFLVDVVEQTP